MQLPTLDFGIRRWHWLQSLLVDEQFSVTKNQLFVSLEGQLNGSQKIAELQSPRDWKACTAHRLEMDGNGTWAQLRGLCFDPQNNNYVQNQGRIIDVVESEVVDQVVRIFRKQFFITTAALGSRLSQADTCSIFSMLYSDRSAPFWNLPSFSGASFAALQSVSRAQHLIRYLRTSQENKAGLGQ